ncbi:MAG: hypothetical protein ABI388_02655 [Bacteroidia bacterium]
MRYIFIFFLLCFTVVTSAQDSIAVKKQTENCIGVYTGFSAFQNITKISNYYSIDNFILRDLLIFFRHKKHEFIGGPIIISSSRSTFIEGVSLSYAYHFGKKRTNLFLEGNIKNTWYTTNENDYIIPYSKSNSVDGSWMSDAKVMVLAAHIALGFEFKIFKFLSGQLAVGPGYFWVNPKPGMQISNAYYYSGTNDIYNKASPDNFYKNHFGFDWYARLGLAWRLYNF